MRHLLDLLTAADRLTATVLTGTQLTERVLPLTCPRI